MNNSLPDDLIPLGKIIKPHGIKGEVKIQFYNRDSDLMVTDKSVWIKTIDGQIKSYDIEKFNFQSVNPILKLTEITNREMAESLRRCEFLLSRSDFPELEDNQFYMIDLIGYQAFDEDKQLIGEVVDILDLSGKDILVVKKEDREYMIPLEDEFVTLFDFENKRVTIKVIDGLLES